LNLTAGELQAILRLDQAASLLYAIG